MGVDVPHVRRRDPGVVEALMSVEFTPPLGATEVSISFIYACKRCPPAREWQTLRVIVDY